MRIQEMNHVNLIGKICTNPKVVFTESGQRRVKFSLTTKEEWLDEKGATKTIKNRHRITAWGKWVTIIEKLGEKGQGIAIEGRLISKFFKKDGKNNSYTEVEVNDLVLL